MQNGRDVNRGRQLFFSFAESQAVDAWILHQLSCIRSLELEQLRIRSLELHRNRSCSCKRTCP